jgi:hypothetical protein
VRIEIKACTMARLLPSCLLLLLAAAAAGMMIGAGSFGRVYKGRWAGRDVAVKVIEHESASAVENEVSTWGCHAHDATHSSACIARHNSCLVQALHLAADFAAPVLPPPSMSLLPLSCMLRVLPCRCS